MSGSAEILAAFRELSNSKQIDRAELHALLQDGIHAALAKKHGPNVQADITIDENRGEIRIVLLKTVVERPRTSDGSAHRPRDRRNHCGRLDDRPGHGDHDPLAQGAGRRPDLTPLA